MTFFLSELLRGCVSHLTSSPLCRWRRQHVCGLVLDSRGRCPALPVLWFLLQTGALWPPPLTYNKLWYGRRASPSIGFSFKYSIRSRQRRVRQRRFHSPVSRNIFGLKYFLVLSHESSSDWSLTCSVSVLDPPANLISLCFTCWIYRGIRCGLGHNCFLSEHFHSAAVYIVTCTVQCYTRSTYSFCWTNKAF